MELKQTSSNQEIKKLSIIVLVYFNEHSLQPFFEAVSNLERTLLEKNIETELIFADDGSGDKSLEELLKIKASRPETKVIKLTRNFGATHAFKAAVQFVTGDCFVTLPPDLQDPPELVPQMIDRWLAGSKFTIAKRTHRADPLTTRLFAQIYYRLVRLFVMKDYPPRGYDVALMDRALLPYMQNSSKNINPPLFAYWLGFKPEVILYQRQKRNFGKSRWTVSKRIKFFLDSLLGFSVAPIRFISLVGFAVSLVSFVYALWIVINAFRGRTGVMGFATIATIVSFLLGLIIMMLGIIGEYIWRIFDELNKRPESVIDEIY